MASCETRKQCEGSASPGCQQTDDETSSLSSVLINRELFLEKVRESNEAIQQGDFVAAVRLYSDAIELDPVNHILYSNRSAAYIKLEQFENALKDALKAKELDSTWTKAYYREGMALQFLNRHSESLAAFACGLALDPRNGQLLSGIVDTALKSPLKGRFQPTYQQLQNMKLDRSPFVIISIIGQDLLACNYYSASVVVLESALRVGTCSLKLRGSVFSALSSAHWLLKNTEQAVAYMQQDLSVAKSLGDQLGECRVHGNLGSAHFTKGDYRESLTHHRCQLRLAMRLKLREAAASALSSLGHVYSAVGDYPNALASHKQCVLLVKQSGDRTQEAREIGAVGAVYTAMGDADNALVCHEEHLRMARAVGDRSEEARALSNLGSAHHCRRDYTRAAEYHNEVLRVAHATSDGMLEARAFAGLGHAMRAAGDLSAAKQFHERQLDCALRMRDRAAEARAIANMGVVYQQLGEHEAALKLHSKHLSLATRQGDRAAQGRAYGNIGIAHSALGRHEAAIKFHKEELAISKEVHDRHSEASTHGNLAVAYQALGMWEQALQHYSAHLNIARELKDIGGEARALSNVGHYYSVRGEFAQAVPFYQQQLQLSQELQDARGEASACHCLGFAHHALGAHREAVLYYDQYLALARELGDRLHEARAQCNLGLAHVALGQYARALDCQYSYLQAAHELRSVPNKFRAMGNIGDILVKMGSLQEALILYGQQLKLAKQIEDRSFEASAYGSLGVAHRTLKEYDKALSYHAQELEIHRELDDVRGQCRAYGSHGDTCMAAGDYESAFEGYQQQLECARAAKDIAMEAQACGNMAIARMNSGRHEEAIGHLEQQLATLEQIGTTATGSGARVAPPLPAARLLLEKGRAYGNLGDCYEALRDGDEAVRCQEQFLMAAQGGGSLVDQDRAYRGLADAHRAVGNLQQALVCCEKRLVVAHEMDNNASKASAYGELGNLHSLLGNFDQAINCLEHQITLAKEQNDRAAEASACCGLGTVYQQMGECRRAVEYHRRDLAIAISAGDAAGQCRAYGNLGLAYESLGELAEALSHQEQHLSLAAQTGNLIAKTLAYSSLGRVHHALGRHADAVQYLRQGLQIADTLGRREDEAKIRHRLGLALWAHGTLDEAHAQLCRAAELFESIRRDAQVASDYKLSLFDLQTASYQALQRVLVALGRHEEALLMAERGRTRAFVDLLLERQTSSIGDYAATDSMPITMEQIRSAVDKVKASVIYYSIAAGQLYSWLILPEKGLVKFHECSMAEAEMCSGADDSQSLNASVLSALDQCLGQTRESLGVDSHQSSVESSTRSIVHKKYSNSSSTSSASAVAAASDAESEADDLWQQHLEDIGCRLNADGDRTGFLRMISRNQTLNSSSYSLSSLFSLSSSLAGGVPGRRTASAAATRCSASWNGCSPLSTLYSLLIAPMEEHLPHHSSTTTGAQLPSLVVVLQGDLYLVPFALLKGSSGAGETGLADGDGRHLFERFAITVAPSLSSLTNRPTPSACRLGLASALVVGNPNLPLIVRELWHLSDLPSAEHEAKLVGDILGVRPCIGAAATKELVSRSLPSAEVVHVAAHISWRLSAIVLSPSEALRSNQFDDHALESANDEGVIDPGDFDSPSLGEYLLTAADILNIKLHAKLVVLSSGHTDDRAARINSDGVIGLTRALLAAGVRCVLFSLWPVPPDASKAFMKMFYLALLQGRPASQALSEAMKKVLSVKQFSHPSNWAGWVLVGVDVKLSSKAAMMGQALCEVLQSTSSCREAFRVLLHLVEKSLQRIQNGEEKGMYTTVESIESKIGANVHGWKDLLTSVGFSFEMSSSGSNCSSAGEEVGAVATPVVFFPLSDPGDRLSQCSGSLQALLALPRGALAPLARLLHNHDAGEAIIVMLKDMLSRNDASNQMHVRVKLWRVDGCHELLASLGFDLLDVGKDEVTVKMGKLANRRTLQLAVQALAVLFNSHGSAGGRGSSSGGVAGLSSSSSMESLNSSHSSSNTTTTSNFSKDSSTPHDSSTPPLSPTQGKFAVNAKRAPDVIHGQRRDWAFEYSNSQGNYASSSVKSTIKSRPMPTSAARSARSPRYSAAGGDDKQRPALRRLGPGLHHDAGCSHSVIMESDDTPTDETGSVSSTELSSRTLIPFCSRLPPQGRDAENHSTPSSHSENEDTAMPVLKHKNHMADPMLRRHERPKTGSARHAPPGIEYLMRSAPPEPLPRMRSGSASSSNSSSTSSRTMTATAAAAKDVADLARKVMADTQAEWLAVEELQRLSMRASKHGTDPSPAAAQLRPSNDNDEGVSVDADPALQEILGADRALSSTDDFSAVDLLKDNAGCIDSSQFAAYPNGGQDCSHAGFFAGTSSPLRQPCPPVELASVLKPSVAPKPRLRLGVQQQQHSGSSSPQAAGMARLDISAKPGCSAANQVSAPSSGASESIPPRVNSLPLSHVAPPMTDEHVSSALASHYEPHQTRGSSSMCHSASNVVPLAVSSVSASGWHNGIHNKAFCAEEPSNLSLAAVMVETLRGHGGQPNAHGNSASFPPEVIGRPAVTMRPPGIMMRSGKQDIVSAPKSTDISRQSAFENSSFIHDDVTVGETVVIGSASTPNCPTVSGLPLLGMTNSHNHCASDVNGISRYLGVSSRNGTFSVDEFDHAADQVELCRLIRKDQGWHPAASSLNQSIVDNHKGEDSWSQHRPTSAVTLPAMFYVAAGLKSSEC